MSAQQTASGMGARSTRGLLALCTLAVLMALVPAHDAMAQARKSSDKSSSAPQRTAAAEENKGVPNALQGFSQNRDQPVQVEADQLEVRDKEKVATFTGNVHVIQGDTDMRSRRLVVFYDDDTAKPTGAKSTLPATGQQQQQIKRLEALGNVIVVQKDQTATGDKGVFDMKSNTITLSGNVLLTQSDNAISGERLVVDMTTGVSRVETAKGGTGRVKAILKRGSTAPSATPAPSSSPGAPHATAPASPGAPSPGAATAAPPPSRMRGLY